MTVTCAAPPEVCCTCCRYKLGSERFINQLPDQRAFLAYETLQRMTGAHAFLRQLLWREPLPYPLDSAAARQLIKNGQVINDNNEYAPHQLLVA